MGRDIVIGMAGHIDHGKTTVIKYLTGVDTDTLPEEKKRGMTIDIGFSKILLDSGKSASIVDVPGHEKFIKNMSAGVSGVDYLLLVIACDDGIMPQTVEHFQIANIFGVKRGMILLTKRDMVSSERYEEVRSQCIDFFSDSFLAGCPILPISNRDLESYRELKKRIEIELEKIDLEGRDRYFRMDVDRVFTAKGFGCVVTGTIKSGFVRINDTLNIYPQNKEIRVKGIESHNEKREYLRAGNRCALNIGGVESEEVKRGDIIAKSLIVTENIEGKITLLKEASRVKNNQRVRLNIGTEESIGRVQIYGQSSIEPGNSGFVRVNLERGIGVNFQDRGVLRNYSPITTLGGIEILFFNSEKISRRDERYLEFLNLLSKEGLKHQVEELVKKGFSQEKISTFLGEKISLEGLLEEKRVYEFDKKIVHRDEFKRILAGLTEFLEKFHRENSLEKGVLRSEIKERFLREFTLKEYISFLNDIEVQERIELRDEYLALKDFKIRLNKDEKLMKEEIFSYYKNQKFNLFPYSYYLEQTKNRDLFEKVHRYMKNEGFIAYLDEDKFILNGFLKESIKLIERYFEENDTIAVKDMRALLNSDRDSAILILRELDRLKITKNLDGVRVLNNRR
ncbi:selenocysteine-specific translation elongation factor [Fusobacterium sp.]|uniref:selenocysteine-specific translation elongation factor n=1 Tax=Fusobacterium sp. TaxID=68766 RepID=UPI0025C633BF|nr:selenocysteine-specific translation elongation factor [Fusobacterium sp.]